ncbi:hypothetical protein G3I13_17605 [Streptomyces sp. SID6673]|nr:hypothetical protein [Streptomyces sp. SID11726]NEB26153.1 hypothetical protein [Streptomyces sp. SID6673]
MSSKIDLSELTFNYRESRAMADNDDGSQQDWYMLVRNAAILGASYLPYVGTIASALLDALWPRDDGKDLSAWDQVKSEVENLIRENFDTHFLDEANVRIRVIEDRMKSYLREVQYAVRYDTPEQWQSAIISLVTTRDHLHSERVWLLAQGTSDETRRRLTLPHSVLLGTMVMTLQRDYYYICRDHKTMEDKHYESYLQDRRDEADAYVAEMSEEVRASIAVAREHRKPQAAKDEADAVERHRMDGHVRDHRIAGWRTMNQFDRYAQLKLLSFVDLWQYFVNGAPGQSLPQYTIYSDPYGTADGHGVTVPEVPTPEYPGCIAVWADRFVNGVQVWYDTTAPRDTKQSPQSNGTPLMGRYVDWQHQHNWQFETSPNSTNYPVRALVRYADVIHGIGFENNTGQQTGVVGWEIGGKDEKNVKIEFEGHRVRGVKIMGLSNAFDCADCIVIAFGPVDTDPNVPVAHTLFVYSPEELATDSLQDSTDDAPSEIPAEWVAERAAHWERIAEAG